MAATQRERSVMDGEASRQYPPPKVSGPKERAWADEAQEQSGGR